MDQVFRCANGQISVWVGLKGEFFILSNFDYLLGHSKERLLHVWLAHDTGRVCLGEDTEVRDRRPLGKPPVDKIGIPKPWRVFCPLLQMFAGNDFSAVVPLFPISRNSQIRTELGWIEMPNPSCNRCVDDKRLAFDCVVPKRHYHHIKAY